MGARRLAANAVLMVALGLAVGHLLAVGLYQRDELLVGRSETTDPALRRHGDYQALVERRSLAVAGMVALAAAAFLGAGGMAEGLVLLLAGYGALGATTAAEMALLGYERVPWPLAPWAGGEKVGLILAVCLGLVALAALVIGRAWAAEAPGRGRARRPQRSPARSGMRRDLPDRPARPRPRSTDQREPYHYPEEDADARPQD